MLSILNWFISSACPKLALKLVFKVICCSICFKMIPIIRSAFNTFLSVRPAHYKDVLFLPKSWPILNCLFHHFSKLFLKNGQFPANRVYFIFVFSVQLAVNTGLILFADDWIRSKVLWCRKRPLINCATTTAYSSCVQQLDSNSDHLV